MKKKTFYGLRIRINDNEEWSEAEWFKSRKERDRAASFSRIIGGLRTFSFDEKREQQIQETIKP